MKGFWSRGGALHGVSASGLKAKCGRQRTAMFRLARASCKSLWSSYKGRVVDVSATRGEEGRDRLRKAWGSCQISVDPKVPE